MTRDFDVIQPGNVLPTSVTVISRGAVLKKMWGRSWGTKLGDNVTKLGEDRHLTTEPVYETSIEINLMDHFIQKSTGAPSIPAQLHPLLSALFFLTM